MLLIPDLINYWLTREKTCEFTNATTTQLYGLEAGGWAEDLLQKMPLPDHIFPKIVPPATKLGLLLREVGLDAQLPVVVVASHDQPPPSSRSPRRVTTSRTSPAAPGSW